MNKLKLAIITAMYIVALCALCSPGFAQTHPDAAAGGFGSIREIVDAHRSTGERNEPDPVDVQPIDISKLKAKDPALVVKNLSKTKSASRVSATAATTATGSGENSWLTSEPSIVVPPSPTASSIMQGSNESVDLYTGKINVQLPLYTLKSRDIEVPIGLSYNSSGIKVNDVASWVGLGWSLQAGGSISRVMKGLPDEFSGKVLPPGYRGGGDGINGYGYLNIKPLEGGIVLSDFTTYSVAKQKKIIKYADWTALDGMDKGDGYGFGQAWDTEPDEFYFNFGNYSGKFMFDQDGDIHFLPNQNFKISKTIQTFNVNGKNIPKIVSFTITTDEGVKYTFGDASLNTVEQSQLVTIRKTVNYFFQSACTNYGSYCVYTGNDELYGAFMWAHKVTEPLNEPEADLRISNPFFTSTWYLREIESPGGDKVTFNYVKPTYTLSYTQSWGERVKMPNLSEAEYTDYSTNPPTSVWLFISADLESALKGQEVTFAKNVINVDSRRLSSIEAAAGNQVEFITQTSLRQDLLEDQALEYVRIYDDRHVNVKSYKLEFTYQEPAVFEDMNVIETSQLFNGNSWVSRVFYENDDSDFLEILFSEQIRLMLKNVYELNDNNIADNPPYEFVYDPQILPRRTNYRQDKWGYYNNNNRGTRMPRVSYTGQYGLPVGDSQEPFWIWRNLLAPEPSYLGANQSANLTKSQAGILKKVIYPTAGAREFFYELNTSGSYSVGGLRVKEIRSYPEVSNTSNYISEFYTYEGGKEVRASGYKYSIPTSTYGDEDVFFNADPTNPWELTKGGVVGYRTVKKFQPGKGKTIYTFKTPAEIGDPSTTVYHIGLTSNTQIFPFPPATNKDWLRGVSEQMKITLDDETKTLSQIDNTYNISPSNFTPTIVYGLTAGVLNLDGFEHYRYGLYQYQSGWSYLETQVTTDFDSQAPGNLSSAYVHSVDNAYDVKNFSGRSYTFLRSTTLTGVTGESLKTEYRYPLDVDNFGTGNLPSSPVAKAHLMMSRTSGLHMLRNPVEIIKYRNNQVVESLVQTYKGFPDGSNNIKPYQSFLLESNAPLTDYTKFNIVNTGNYIVQDSRSKLRLTFLNYDAFGHVLTQQKNNDVVTSYLWGYNNTFPVAEVRNATNISSTRTFPFTDHASVTIASYEGMVQIMSSFVISTGQQSITFGLLANGTNPPPSPLINLILKRADGTRVMELTGKWGQYTYTTNIGPGTYQWYYTTGDVSFSPPSLTSVYLSVSHSYNSSRTGNTVFHTSFEDDNGNNTSISYTGKKSRSGTYTFYLPGTNGNYKLTYMKWNGAAWDYIEENITVSSGLVEAYTLGTTSSIIDEVRLYPATAQMTTYSYDPIRGMTSTADLNSRVTYYDYDAYGRLQYLKDSKRNILKSFDYHYKGGN